MSNSSDYFAWLTSQITIVGNNHRTYNELFAIMFEFEFVWFISGDDNRLQDAMDLRHYFLDDENFRKSGAFDEPEFVTILEVLIAISRRMAFIAGGEGPLWAWQLIENLGLERATDPLSVSQKAHVKEILERFLFRTYEPDGRGGLFPLAEPKQDQTQIEIWYQMNSYVDEIREPV